MEEAFNQASEDPKVANLVGISPLEAILGEELSKIAIHNQLLEVAPRSPKDLVETSAGQLKVWGKHRLHPQAPRAKGSCLVGS